MHPLQDRLEESKDCFLEHVARRAWLQHPGWIEERGWGKKDADRFYKITTVCDILRYTPPVVHACAALAQGSKPLTRLKADPPHRIYEAMARLELASRNPKRRAELFDWEKAAISKREYWEATVGDLSDQRLLLDNSDFGINIFLRLVYLFGELPASLKAPWLRPERRRDPRRPAQIPIDPDFDEGVQAKIQKVLLSFKYWHDESFRAVDEPKLRDARRDKNVADKRREGKKIEDKDRDGKQYQYEMQYWSENHQILFATAEYLAGQMFPDQIFRPGAAFRSKPSSAYRDFTGRMRMGRARERLIRWLDDRLRFGFSEWNAPGYYDEHFTALFNLADFCLDEQIRGRAMMALDLMVFDLARFTHAGSFSVGAGRAHFKHKNCGWQQSVSDVIEMLFDSRKGVFASDGEMSGTSLVTSRRYDAPEVLLSIGRSKPRRFVDRSRVSIEFGEGAEFGIGFDREEDVLRWWSRAAWFAKQVVDGTRKLVDRYGLDKTKPYSDILPKLTAGAAVASGAGVMGYIAAGPIAAPLLGNPFASSSDIADSVSIITEGSAYTRGNLYTYRNRDAMLSSVLNHRAGQLSFQGHNCQATLSMCATVFTSHPSAGGGIDSSIAEAAGILGGGLLGAALGGPAGLIGGAIAGGKVLGKDIILLEADSDGPDWWTGSITQPRVMQLGNAAILAYNPKAFQLALFGHRTHAWFPLDAFDADPPPSDPAAARSHIPSRTPVPSRNANVASGAWIFGKAKEGGGFIGLYSGQHPVITQDGDWARKEIVAEGKRNIFIIQIGNADEFGSYARFKERVLNARIHINGLHWQPSDFECSYDIPGGSRLELHYDDDQVRYAGAQVSDDEHPRFDNPYARVAWQQNRYVIEHGGHSLTHDIRMHERRSGAATPSLAHDVQLRFQAQNMGLFHHIPPYKGKDRDGALRKLIEVLRTEQPDVVGLSEMWHGPDRDKIREELGNIYPYIMEGPLGSDFVRGAAIVGGIGAGVAAGAAAGSVFGPAGSIVGGIAGGIFGGSEGKDAPLNGGLMLLSRHPISRSNRTIYHQSAGEDSLSYKGVLHSRIRPHGHPCEYDVFLSHTQNLAPIVGEDDAKEALGRQIRHLAAFIRSCREPAYPALLMGDLNVDAFDPGDRGLLDLLHGELSPGLDMVPQVVLPIGQTRARPQATSESDDSKISSFNEGNDDLGDTSDKRFGPTAQRLDYFFTWRGLLYEPHFTDAQVRVIQSSPGKDLSDHYGIQCRLSGVTQRLPGGLPQGSLVSVKPARFRCLDTTDGPGSDEVEFTIRCVAANGQELSVTSKRYEDIDQGSAGVFDSHAMLVSDPEEFVMIAASAKEIDSLSADDDMGTTQVTLGWRELAALDGSTFRLGLPRLTGDGGEYVVEVDVSVTQRGR
jgi:endonuclease/exonuclease/phosphatase family metal-dependent hydrolase